MRVKCWLYLFLIAINIGENFDFDIFVARQIRNETWTLASVTPSRDLYRQSNYLEKKAPQRTAASYIPVKKEKRSEPKRYQSNKNHHLSGATIQSLRVSEGRLMV